jgi:hypothetical protein
MNVPIFITGLPRSRTVWLANVFTWGPAFVEHDALKHLEDVAELPAHLAALAAATGASTVGTSDSGLLMVWRRVVELFPQARWLHVRRPLEEARLCFFQAFGRTPYLGTRPVTWPEVVEMFEWLRMLQEEFVAEMPGALTVPMEALSDPAALEAAWRHLLPDVDYPEARNRMLIDFRLQIMPERVAVDPARVLRMVASAKGVPA